MLLAITMLALSSCEREKKPIVLPPRPVQIGKVSQEPLTVYSRAIGNVYAINSVPIVSQVTGQIVEAHVKEGSEVKAGDLLFTIDPRPYEAALAQAKANYLKDQAALQFAQDRLNRNKDLVKKDYISQLTFEQYQTDVETLTAQLEFDKAAIITAELNLEWCSIIAPINGRLSFFQLYPGSIVTANNPNTPITTILEIDPIEVRFAITQKQFQKLKTYYKGKPLPMEFTLKSGETAFKGEVVFFDNQVSLQTGTVMLMAHLPNNERGLWPGEYGVAKVTVREIPEAIVVPEEAIQEGQQGFYLYVLKPDMTVELRTISIGEKVEGRVEVLKGVSPGETVVTTGQINLRPGMQVVVTDSSGKPIHGGGEGGKAQEAPESSAHPAPEAKGR